ncbi:MAG: ATP-dependent Clp protease proteolytic subunit [Chitinispirillia bacterium]|jgi:ATP-dependent Clp protease protease subunit
MISDLNSKNISEGIADMFLNKEVEKKILEERQIYLVGEVSDESVKPVIQKLLYFDSIEKKDITLFINSPGGSISAGLGIFDTVNCISSDVKTVAFGLAASMGMFLLCTGAKGKRYSYTHTRILIHQPLISGNYIGTASDVQIFSEEMLEVRKIMNQIISERTGKTIKQIEDDSDRNNWMSAKQALEYGIIDKIIKKMPF